MMQESRSYGWIFLAGVLGLSAAAGWVLLRSSFSTLKPGDGKGENRGGFSTSADPALIQPSPDLYRRYTAEDAAWRARNARPVALAELQDGWLSTPRDTLIMRAGQLYQARDLDGAIVLTRKWVADHPDDHRLELELAHLLNEAGRPLEALPHYQRLLDARDDRAIRHEYAGALLLAARYAEAAREFTMLATTDSTDVDAHYGLARAFDWGGYPRQAEREAMWLRDHDPANSAYAVMLEEARGAFDPTVADASRWAKERPDYPPYLLALARALEKDGQYRRSAVVFDRLLAMAPGTAAYREAAWVHARYNDLSGAAALIAKALAGGPGDAELRGEYARLLTWTGDYVGAIDQYDRLLAAQPAWKRDPALLARRGELYTWAGDLRSGARDLAASAALKPDAEVLGLLGDVYRWQGDLEGARAAYESALSLRRGDPRSRDGLLAVAQQERLAHTVLPPISSWLLSSSFAGNSSDYVYLAAGAEGTASLTHHLAALFALEERRVSSRTTGRPGDQVSGHQVTAGAEWTTSPVQVVARSGVLRHPGFHDVFVGSMSVSAFWPSLTAVLELDAGPAYLSLMAPGALVRDPVDAGAENLLTEQSARVRVVVPVGRSEVSSEVERVRLSDGNREAGVRASVRVPLNSSLTLLYNGRVLGYRQRSDRYWDPVRYMSHSVGVEMSATPIPQAGFKLRVVPGIAHSTQQLPLPGNTLQSVGTDITSFATSGEMWYRVRGWELGADLSYDHGRDYGYRALGGALRVRAPW